MRRWLLLYALVLPCLLGAAGLMSFMTGIAVGECAGLLTGAGFVVWMIESRLDAPHQ